MSHRNFTYEQIAAEFSYLSHTGQLFRRLADGGLRELKMVRERTGDRAGSFTTAQAEFRGHNIRATHIAFLLMRRRWPLLGMIIDHRNGNVFNCRWTNLREGTKRQNQFNKEELPRPSLRDTSGLERGVYQEGNRYVVQLRVEGRSVYFGIYPTKEEANAVATAKRAELHGEWSFEASRGVGA
jgi:hypothetical protein